LTKPGCSETSRLWRVGGLLSSLLVGAWAANQADAAAGQPGLSSTDAGWGSVESVPPGIWENGVGEGFRSGTRSFSFSAGGLAGLRAFGAVEVHDLVLVNFEYGRMLGPVRGEGHWYRGNPEFRVELFTGAQVSPSVDWLVGLTPHIRYDFATGTRWVPFVDVGAGVTATGIGPPDLSGTFEFNLQAGGGVYWLLKDDVALDLEVHCVHWSCAGISEPNLGLNGIQFMAGLTIFF